MQKIIQYFSDKHILINFLVIAIFVGAVIFWNKTGKEEMPNITFDTVSVSINYPGATAEEVEYFVTKEIEDALEGIDGIDEISSSSAQGSCSIRITLTPNNPERDTVVSDIKEAVAGVSLPDDIDKSPNVREFKSSQFGILDVMMYYNDVDIMTTDQRLKLQSLADTLQEQLIRVPAVSEIGIGGDMTNYIEITVDPIKLVKYNISLSEVMSAIKANNLKQPLGTLDDDAMTKIRLNAELNKIDEIKEIIIRSDFEGNTLKVKSIADVKKAFQRQRQITKVNGSEALRLDVTKKSGFGILKSVDSVKEVVNRFNETTLKDSDIKITFMNDGSEGVRSRLSLIASNGLLGFILIVTLLLIFLNFKSAFWVAMGIPFSFAFTMIAASLMGNTINNMTLAAVIIVMGMLVDDAIVVAENISRLKDDGMPLDEAVVKGTATVFLPILGSITTTCVAFIPLFFFQGRFALMTRVIPPIIFLMLGGSLFEALFILPSHLKHKFPRWLRVVFSLGTLPLIEKYYEKNKKNKKEAFGDSDRHWFLKVEDAFGNLLARILRFKLIVFILFISILTYSSWIFFTKMKFSMFPREETSTVFLSGAAPQGTLKYDTEKLVRQVEAIFTKSLGNEVVAFRTNISQSRRGRSALENVFSIFIELVPTEKRKRSSKQIIAEWDEELKIIKGFDTLNFGRGYFGQSSGSPIEIQIQENDDETKFKVAEEIQNYFKRMPSLINPEIETVLYTPQYSIKLKRELMNRLGVSISTIATTLRTVLEGNNIFDIIEKGDTIDVIVTVPEESKNNIEAILNIPIQNSNRYLVPLYQLVDITKTKTPDSISRINAKRVLHVYADLNDKSKKDNNNSNPGSQRRNNGVQKKDNIDKEEKIEKFDIPEKMTPLEIGNYLETNLFPELLKKYPTTHLVFTGEIADSRESNKDFQNSVIMVILLIYVILSLTLGSLNKPLIIMLSIPFGFAGIILAFQAHGMLIYGFFSFIGALGLAGVVVNDSIILLDKLEMEYPKQIKNGPPHQVIANITKTRLRAVLLTTITTVAGLLPTAYGVFGYDSMLAEMMLALAWGLIFGTLITLILVPTLYCSMKETKAFLKKIFNISPKVIIILLLLFSFNFIISSEEKEIPISLQDFIADSTKNSHFSRILLKEINAVYQERIKTLPGDFVLSIQSEYQLNYDWIQKEDNGTSTTSKSASSDAEYEWKDYNNFKGSVSLSKLFSYTGTTLSGSYSISPRTTYETATSSVNLKIEQDIAKNAFGFATRVQNKIAGNEKQIAYYQAVEAYEDYLSSLIVIYMEWYVAYKNLEASRKSYQESLSLLESTRKKRSYNIALPVDVYKSELQTLSKEESLTKAKTDYEKSLFLVKNILGIENNNDITPDFDYIFDINIKDIGSVFEGYKTESRAAKVLSLTSKNSELTNVEVINDLLPTAKLFASYSITGNGYFLDVNDEQTLPSHTVNMGGSLTYKIPQWGTFAKYKAQKIDNEGSMLDEKNSLNDIWNDLNQLYLNIKNEKVQLELAKQKGILSKRIADEELVGYNQGRSSLNDLIQVYNTLDTNILSEIDHSTQLSKYYIEWLRLTDGLVTNEKKVNL